MFFYQSLITQQNFGNLNEELQEEIFQKYCEIYKIILENFIAKGNFLFSFLKNYLNIFYNFNEELIDTIEDYQEELKNINKEFTKYKVIRKLNDLIILYKYYNKYIIEDEALIDVVKEYPYFVYLIDPKYIEIDNIFDLLDELIFSIDEGIYDFAINKLLLFFYKFSLENIYINNPKDRERKLYTLFDEIIFELVHNKTGKVKEEFKYPILKLMQKYEFNIEESDNKNIIIEMIFDTFNKKNFQKLSGYYMNYIYLYYKEKYKNHYKEKLKNLIVDHGLLQSFLKSKYLFNEESLIKDIIKEYKKKGIVLTFKVKEEYFKNPYFELPKQTQFFNFLDEKTKKIFLLNNPNINVLLLKTNKIYINYALKNINFIKNLIFS